MASVGILVAGTVSALFTSFTIGANDVANAFGTSVGAKVLTLKQAMIFAGIFEFLGAFLMGSHVSDTIRKGIVNTELFSDAPNELMLGMLCALIATGVWLLIATLLKLPVSTTHSIIGAILGFAIATRGAAGVNWEKIALVVASWVISPVLSGILAAAGFWTLRKYVLRKENSPQAAVSSIPLLLGLTMLVNTFFVIYKGSPGLGLKNTPLGVGIGVSCAVAVVTGIFGKFVVAPYAERKVARLEAKTADLEKNLEDAKDAKANGLKSETDATDDKVDAEQVKVETVDEAKTVEGETKTDEAAETAPATEDKDETDETPSAPPAESDETPDAEAATPTAAETKDESETPAEATETPAAEAAEAAEAVVSPPMSPTEDDPLSKDAKATKKLSKFEQALHGKDPDHFEHSEVFNPSAEATFSVLQVLTACFSAFAHGSNDLANAIGPYAAIYGIYVTGVVQEENAVPPWMLAMGGAGIVVGLGCLGHHVILTIGRNLTKVTPSRGFNIELGAAITVVVASRIGIPVSTSHSQVGSVIGVGRVDGQSAVNWGLFRNIAISWLVTLPFTGLLTAAIFGILWNLVTF